MTFRAAGYGTSAWSGLAGERFCHLTTRGRVSRLHHETTTTEGGSR